jgi:hypothetical protein
VNAGAGSRAWILLLGFSARRRIMPLAIVLKAAEILNVPVGFPVHRYGEQHADRP